MILKVLTNSWQVLDNVDSKTAKRGRISDPGEHQQLRARDRSGSKDHFLVRRNVVDHSAGACPHPTTPSSGEVQVDHGGAEQHGQVRPRERRVQKGTSGADASSIGSDVHVDVAGAGTHRPVHIVEDGHTHLPCSVYERGRCGMRIPGPTDVYRPAEAAPLV